MKTTLYYFSGTGNTLYLAQQLAKELGDTELVSIATVMKQEKITTTSQNVGILFPIYCFGTPNIIKEFLQKLTLPKTTYLFGAVSFGGLLSSALKIFQRECVTAGLNLQAGFGLQMPGNAIAFYDRISSKKEEKFAAILAERIPQIATIIKEQIPHKMEQRQLLLQPLMGALHTPFMKKIPKGAADFFVTDSCNLCGECIKLCPVENIKLIDKKILWEEHCEQCMACIQWCSQEAIQVGKKSASRTRYHHPEITKEAIMKQG